MITEHLMVSEDTINENLYLRKLKIQDLHNEGCHSRASWNPGEAPFLDPREGGGDSKQESVSSVFLNLDCLTEQTHKFLNDIESNLQFYRTFAACNPHYTLTEFAQEWSDGNHTRTYFLLKAIGWYQDKKIS
ncbi:MAG TPA: hypothetical protein VNJ29_03530 [Candidatus Nitrosotenuis sp.]|jgi:hypothetical protein|nr:hypothetical protein [Candidatus Nitrosotenuis sp.]